MINDIYFFLMLQVCFEEEELKIKSCIHFSLWYLFLEIYSTWENILVS